MTNLPVILVLVNTSALRKAIAQNGDGLDLRWSVESQGNEVSAIAALLPTLIVIELDRPADWLYRVRSDPATRRIPVIAVADDESARQRAASAHVDAMFRTDELMHDILGILTRHARVYDKGEALRAQCETEPSALVLRGLHEFNAGEYFECHETLEEAWNKEPGPTRELYRAILQVSVAYLQITRHNFSGAQKMFLRMLQWFAPLPDRCQGIDVAQLRADVVAVRTELDRLGPERIGEFDRRLLKPIHYAQRTKTH